MIEPDIKWLLSVLESAVAGGDTFRHGETFQIGGMILQIRKTSDDKLSLYEPDGLSFPIAWSESVTMSLMHLRLQTAVAESVLLNDEMAFSPCFCNCLVCSHLGSTGSFVLDRAQMQQNDSGWFFGCDDERHDHNDIGELIRVSLYEAMLRYEPRVIPFLALPVGTLVLAGNKAPCIFKDGQQLAIVSGSYLCMKHAER